MAETYFNDLVQAINELTDNVSNLVEEQHITNQYLENIYSTLWISGIYGKSSVYNAKNREIASTQVEELSRAVRNITTELNKLKGGNK